MAAGITPLREAAIATFLHCRARLAPYRRIRRIKSAALPKTISGKNGRVELRQLEAERRARGTRLEPEYFEEALPSLKDAGRTPV